MLNLTASYSKKVPASEEYSSRHYHGGVELEIPDNLPPAELRRRIQNTFILSCVPSMSGSVPPIPGP